MTKFVPLPVLAPLADYEQQAAMLLAAFRSREPAALDLFRRLHPRFLDPVVTWKPRELAAGELEGADLSGDDARLAVARGYSYRDWQALADHVAAVQTPDSAVRAFELASEAVIAGDLGTLEAMLGADPALVRARSVRVTCHDPAVHGATLLHYLAANGIEGYRQRSPANAPAVARRLLEAGAEVDALARMYGGEYATMSMLVSSTPPAAAGVQVPLVEVLLDFGASADGVGSAQWGSNVRTALLFGFRDAAAALVARGAATNDLVLAAGLGRLADVRAMLADSSPEARHGALAMAAMLGQAAVVNALLDAGESPDRFNPDGMHAHGTPLHQAALGGHLEVVRLLVDRGARLDLRDSLWDGTPLGWAKHGEQTRVAELLAAAGAPE